MKFWTKGFWKRFAIGIGLFLFLIVAYIYFPWPITPAESFEVVAHRGVFQTFPLDNLANDTCTAKIIYPPTHTFLENTLPSIREAFDKGATVVEFDIHRTADDHLIVFHDWTVDCRTDGRGVTNELTLAYLQSLDIGYGYTADGGESYPLRGQRVGMMPTLEKVMAAFPDKHFVINNKDGGDETRELLVDFLKTLTPEARSRLSYWGVEYPKLNAEVPEIDTYIFGRGEVKACFWNYIGMLIAGTLPESCRQNIIGIPFAALNSIPGWPNLILARAHQAGARVYVTDVDTPEQWARVKDLPLDGIQTNRIEVIGPLLNQE
jgi:glycerophosphoryl diester phosphodiesterase